MQHPVIKFLGWDRPAVDLVAEQLLIGLNAPETAERFRRATVVVPTAESGRRLRERLPELAGRPVLIPRVQQPVHLVQVDGAAEDMVELAAWIKVLSVEKPQEVWPTLFPAAPVNLRNWSHGMGQKLQQLRRRLEEACLTPSRIAADLDDEHEAARWNEIETIFSAVDDCLGEWGYKPSMVCYAAAMREAVEEYAGRTIIVACLPQMSARFRQFLDAVLARGGQVIIYVQAPVDMRCLFDARYGVPLASWAKQMIDIPESALCVVPDGQGMAMAALGECAGLESDSVVLGCCDSSFTPALRNAFQIAGWQLNVPEGRSFLATEAGQWLSLLQRALAEPHRVMHVEPLLRNELMQRCFQLPPAKRQRLSNWLDEEMRKRLPASMERMLEHARASRSQTAESAFVFAYLSKVQKMLEQFSHDAELPATLNKLAPMLVAAYAGTALEPALQHFAEMMQQVAGLLEQVPTLCNVSFALGLLHSHASLHAQGSLGLVATPREMTALDASGWMELPYCSGNKLVLCGLHESCVPEPPSVDAFLPESLCRRYPQLAGMEQRVARDSFMLRALLAAYGESVRIIVARNADDGTPVVPSQLLLRCPANPPQLLIERVDSLFSELPPVASESRAGVWRMRTPSNVLVGLEDISLLGDEVMNPWQGRKEHFSPSTLANFLACPLRFWLKELLGLDPRDTYDPGKTALDAMEYGTELHAVLEMLVKAFPRADASATREAMVAYATQCLKERFARFGAPLSLPLAAQQDMMERNLHLFVDCHLKDLAAGWENVYLEYRTNDSAWRLDGDILFHMTLDRVDRRAKADGSGYQWRIIDYKTGTTEPRKKHLEAVRPATQEAFQEFLPELPLLPLEGKKGEVNLHRWKEVQLPLYAQWLMDTHHIPLEDIEVAYYLMPRSKKECNYKAWQLTQELQESALLWVRRAVAMIREGRCLVSAESLGVQPYGDFGALAPDGDPRTMMGLPELKLNADI